MKDSKDESKNPDQLLYAIAACFVFVVVGKKLLDLKTIAMLWVHGHVWTTCFVLCLILTGLLTFAVSAICVKRDENEKKKYIARLTSEKRGSVYAGISESGERIFIPLEVRKMHTQVVGTTNAGKSESVIIPWAVGDIKDKRGFVIVDGKADKSFINKIYAYARHFKRAEEFKVFSLQDPNRSLTFNPLLGGTPEEVAERVFNSFEFDNSYYESVQYEIFSQVLRIFDKAKLVPTFLRIYQAIKNPQALYELAVQGKDSGYESWASGFKALSPSDREEKTSGLLSSLSHFAFGSHAKLFNTDTPDIDLRKTLSENELIYFQLPVLKAAFLGKATGKLVLQTLQSVVADRHEAGDKEHAFFSIYLDDFTEYLYPGFVSLLNKSRSANVGVVFAHQALSDIKVLGEEIADTIFTNSNLKIIMRGNDPASAEQFAKMIGTQETEKITERADRGFFGRSKTGQGSVREVEEFVIHPNIIKRNLGVGEAIVVMPHKYGSRLVKLRFRMVPNLTREDMPIPTAKKILGLVCNTEAPNQGNAKTAGILTSKTTPIKEAA